MVSDETTVTEAEILAWLHNLGDGFPPVTVRVANRSIAALPNRERADIDALVDVTWEKQKFRFVVEAKSRSTPKSLETAIDQAKRSAQALELYPLIVIPYLSEENLKRLEQEKTSGLDLCGNGILQVPGKLLVRKSGAPNNFPQGKLIQNVYRGNSSLVVRCFLLQPKYESTQELLATLQSRGASVTLSTVSKVCSTLAEDLVIERERKQRTASLRLLQPDKLLDSLARAYEPPDVRRRFTGKCALKSDELSNRLLSWQTDSAQQIVRTGADSISRYATMAREPIAKFYCTNLVSLTKYLEPELSETTRFADIEFEETPDAGAYFDRREQLFGSPIQCYLELQAGDKRDQETAEQVREMLLKKLGGRGAAR